MQRGKALFSADLSVGEGGQPGEDVFRERVSRDPDRYSDL